MEIKNLASPALFLADNLALDFINSEYRTGDDRHDCFDNAWSVVDWLLTAGLVPKGTVAPPELLTEARQLRDAARAVVYAAMKSEQADLTVINRMLETGRPETRLEWDQDTQRYRVDVRSVTGSSAGLLWPIADALVKLVTDEKFEYVRQCEAHNCILLFHDLSKSHRRRWCSMATCGNRMKVAAFRNRKGS